MQARPGLGSGMNGQSRGIAKFRAEIAAVTAELIENSSGDADTTVQFPRRVGIDHVDLNVLITAGFALRGIGLAKQIERCAVLLCRGLGICRFVFLRA